MRFKTSAPPVLAALLCGSALLGSTARAEDLARKWRVGLGLGSYSPQSEIPSDAANILTLVDETGTPIAVFVDPRRDSLAIATLELQPGAVMNLSGSYAFSKILAIEGSVGRTAVDLGDAEMQVQFDGDVTNAGFEPFNFRAYRLPVGRVDLLPIQVSGVARFRPQAPFNPYIGAGVGYQFASFEPTEEFTRLSENLDASAGIQARIIPAVPGVPSTVFVPISPAQDLTGATVEVPDAFTWHLLAGAEYAWTSRWAAVFDIRHVWSSRSVRVGFNNQDDLGISVPQTTALLDSALADGTYGPMQISSGGIIDGGSLIPGPGHPADTDCAETPIFCRFDSTRPDGVVDTGLYYLNGGEIDFRSFTFTVGVRYTFK